MIECLCLLSRSSIFLILRDLENSILLSNEYLRSWLQRKREVFIPGQCKAWYINSHHPASWICSSWSHAEYSTPGKCWETVSAWGLRVSSSLIFPSTFVMTICLLFSLFPERLECSWLVSVQQNAITEFFFPEGVNCFSVFELGVFLISLIIHLRTFFSAFF